MTVSNAIRLPKIALAPALAVCLALALPAAAQEAQGDPERVYATIDGEPITEADLDVAAQDYLEELSRLPPEMRVAQLLNVVIDMRLLARAAEGAGIDKTESLIRRLAFDRSRALRNEYLRDKATRVVTDESVRARFDTEVAGLEPGDELHLRHILVETEDEARAVIADIDGGGDFAAIAREKSLDPGSGANGGDLGFVPKGRTLPEFEAAAFGLAVGAHTAEPVESQYGWHVIKLEAKRKEPPPQFEAEEDRIRTELIREFVTNEVETLRAAAKIEIVPPPDPPAAVPEDAAPVEGGGPESADDGVETPAE